MSTYYQATLNEPAAREGSELGVRRLLSERIVVVPTQSSDRRSCDGSDDRAASTDDRRHDGSQSLASNPAILRLRGCQSAVFSAVRRSDWVSRTLGPTSF